MKIQFESLGQTYEAEAQNIRGTVWVHFQGRTFTYESEAQVRRSRRASGHSQKGEILSPMPGKITKILKIPGTMVVAGEVILVMEAMKMEYTLKAEMAGRLHEVSCKVGEQVTLGKKLAMIEEATV